MTSTTTFALSAIMCNVQKIAGKAGDNGLNSPDIVLDTLLLGLARILMAILAATIMVAPKPEFGRQRYRIRLSKAESMKKALCSGGS